MIHLTANALRVLQSRYLRRDERGRAAETPEQLFARVARAIAEPERQWGGEAAARRWEEAFLRLMTRLEFLPNSPTLMNAGMPLGQLSACFVLPVEDTMEGIFEALKQTALIQRTGGGTGFSFSRLRPKGDLVSSTGGESSGPVSFMRIFDAATEHIKQGGKRRGANMGILRVDHPDILEFIGAKRGHASLQNFNISVGVTDAFMEAVRRDASYELVNPRTGAATARLKAAEVFREIVQAAWETGDPGLIFLGAIHRANPVPHLGAIEATNPCGEVPLLPHESCNLGSVNVARFIREEEGAPAVDWPRLKGAVSAAVRFLDDVIEASRYPLPETQRISRANRRIGLGLMGFAEALIRMRIPYDSPAAVRFAEELMREIAGEARRASQALAQERGVFPNWQGSRYEKEGIRLRNVALTAIAPTGTISIIAGTSAGIEPLFALAYRRSHVLGDQTLFEVNPLFLEHLSREGLRAEPLIEKILREGSLRGVHDAPSELKRLFVTALEIAPEQHLQIQAAFQRHVDNSVSKTVNLPQEATPEDVQRLYWRAWELGLKGITLYRYGSKSAQVLELGAGEEPYQYDYASRCDPGECRL